MNWLWHLLLFPVVIEGNRVSLVDEGAGVTKLTETKGIVFNLRILNAQIMS